MISYQQYESAFRNKALQSGYSEDNILRCLRYAKPLLDANLPVIYNTANLSAYVGYKKNYIKKAALFTSYFYRNFAIKKKNGEPRILKEPLPSLKEIQIWILKNILYQVPVSRFAKAYIKKRDLLENVKYHRNKKLVVKLDINNFFGSIKRTSVEKIFLDLNYSSNISNLLSKLCCCNEILPQGAPTSPYLSNIYLRHFDFRISLFCLRNNIRYTRYADDMTFSGDFDSDLLIEKVNSIITGYDLLLNHSKTQVVKRNRPQIVTGIVVNDKIQVPKKNRDKIRQEVYYLQKFGLAVHARNTKNYRSNYLRHLLGKINFALYVNPGDKKMQEYSVIVKSLMNTLN